MAGDETSTDFGFERVRLAEKQDRVNEVFRSVAKRYDLMNDLMSGGLHRAWKSAFVSTLRPSAPGRSGCWMSPAAPATSRSARWRPAGPTPR